MHQLLVSIIVFSSILSCQSDSSNTSSTPQERPVKTIPDENFKTEMCFKLEEVTDSTDVNTTTFISFQIQGNEVFGEEAITIRSIEYNAVAVGSIEGHIKDGIITVIYDFTIEGSQQQEEQEFRLEGNNLMMSVGELKEQDGVLVLVEKGLFNKSIPKVTCE